MNSSDTWNSVEHKGVAREPFKCCFFGCGKTLSLIEQLAGNHCYKHSKEKIMQTDTNLDRHLKMLIEEGNAIEKKLIEDDELEGSEVIELCEYQRKVERSYKYIAAIKQIKFPPSVITQPGLTKA